VSPVFVPVSHVRSLFDWFTPLDGCPRCGYAYEREQGYFLLAVWGLNYGVVAGIGMIIGLYLQHRHNPGLWSPRWLWLAWMPAASFLLARHAKSLFLAMDHFFDPHVTTPTTRPRGGAGGGANQHRADDSIENDDGGHERPSQS
jgi:uncharacterized protein (DUF983 family)